MEKFNVNATNVGAVGYKNDVTMETEGVGAKEKTTRKRTTTVPKVKARVLIVVAKGKERVVVDAKFREHWEEQQADADGVTSYADKESGLTVHIAYLDAMGKTKVLEKFRGILGRVKPTHFTTLGVCGSNTANLLKVFLIDKAVNLEGQVKQCHVDEGAPEVWRIRKEMIVRPDKNKNAKVEPDKCVVYTTGEAAPEKLTPATMKEYLASKKADCVDMEIFWMWDCIESRNQLGSKVTILRAIKGVSDDGPDETREKYFQEAAENATECAILYLKHLCQVNILV